MTVQCSLRLECNTVPYFNCLQTVNEYKLKVILNAIVISKCKRPLTLSPEPETISLFFN